MLNIPHTTLRTRTRKKHKHTQTKTKTKTKTKKENQNHKRKNMVKHVTESELNSAILRFGREIVMKLVKEKEYIYFESDHKLLDFGFKKKNLAVVRSQIKREKMIQHLVKSSGKVKQASVGQTVSTNINDSKIEQDLCCKLLLG